jgi:hypothetical protein
VNLDRNMGPSVSLAGREIIQSLEADDPTFVVLNQDDVVADFLADRLFSRIIEPHRNGVTGSIVMNPHFFHKTGPFFTLRVRDDPVAWSR